MTEKENGFTLVELAIVLMIIGLLIGGVLRGQELISNSRISSTIRQVTSYHSAMASFMDTYNSLPGDMPNATTRLRGCIPGNACKDGNGNGIVGAQDVAWNPGLQTINDENTQFWKHLALAHLISGVDPSSSTITWGKTHPAAAFPGGFTVLQTTNTGGYTWMYGLVMHMGGSVSQSPELYPIVSPKQAAQIDRKMDDGVPNTGDVQSSAAGTGGPANDCEITYNEAREDTFCSMAFMLKR